ncbi:MAG TPA: OsmC family protein [Gemmatimonadaceae bacterium]|nr:OsmC family protein [Gemmatimonadaceae bacterium]
MRRHAKAVWRGTGLEGGGTLTTPSGVLSEQPYSFKLRFQDAEGRAGTNPEELIAAAHAGCFAMALSFQLGGAGFPPDELAVDARIDMAQGDGGWSITQITLQLEATVPGITSEQFHALANAAKAGCPVSKALSAVPIALEATLR